MTVSGIGGSGGAGQQPSALNQQNNAPNGAQAFLDYMNETPAQRMEYAWLAQHGLTPQQFDAMRGPEKQKLLNEMKADIELRLKQKVEQNILKTSGAAAVGS